VLASKKGGGSQAIVCVGKRTKDQTLVGATLEMMFLSKATPK